MYACETFRTNPASQEAFKPRSELEENIRCKTDITWRNREGMTLTPGHIVGENCALAA